MTHRLREARQQGENQVHIHHSEFDFLTKMVTLIGNHVTSW